MNHPDLTPERIAELKEDLLGELQALTRRVHATRNAGPVMLDQTAVGRLSRMDALMNQGLAQGSDARTVKELALVEEALARIEAGTGWRSCPKREIVHDVVRDSPGIDGRAGQPRGTINEQ